MKHKDHVKLIEKGISDQGGIWADFGSGAGAFTLALRDVIGPTSTIFSIDKDHSVLETQKARFDQLMPDTDIHYVVADFMSSLVMPPLDGAIAANSIHFEKNTAIALKRLKTFLKPGGKLLIVEYNADEGNEWVPYPFSFVTLETAAKEVGFETITLIGTTPSEFLNEMYAAVLS